MLLGQETAFGKVVAILWLGERYYLIENSDDETISLIPERTIKEFKEGYDALCKSID